MSRNSECKGHPRRNVQFSEDKCAASGDHRMRQKLQCLEQRRRWALFFQPPARLGAMF